MNARVNLNETLHTTYARMSDEARAKAELHQEDGEASPLFTEVRHHNLEIAATLFRLSSQYALLSGVHQDLYDQARRK